MKRIRIWVLLYAMFQITTTACSTGSPVYDSALAGGLVGTGLGAGTGALIAESLNNGDIGKSALVGGGIGLPVGVAMGVGLYKLDRVRKINRNERAIESNQSSIKETQIEIDAQREELRVESDAIIPDKSKSDFIYDGDTMGNPWR